MVAFIEAKTGTWAETYTFFAQSVNHFASSLVDGNVAVVYQALSGNGPQHGKGRYFVMVQKYAYFLPLGNEIQTFLNLYLEFGLKLWLFRYHG
jgi:hypothetical protein